MRVENLLKGPDEGSLVFHTLITNEAIRVGTTGQERFANLYKNYAFSFQLGFNLDWNFASTMVWQQMFGLSNLVRINPD